MAELALARAELADELGDGTRLDAAAEECVERLRAGRDADELGSAGVKFSCGREAERDKLGRYIE
jgi:hypothetical protein